MTRIIFKSILIFINILIILAYLITCLYPFLNTGEDWLLAFPGLIFPLLFFALIIFIIIGIIIKSRWWWISLLALLAGSQQIISVFAFNLPKKFLYEKAPNTLRILQWNVSGWDMYSKNNFGKTYFPLMLNLIQKENPDIMCFEEYYDRVTKKHYQENLVSLTNLGYHIIILSLPIL